MRACSRGTCALPILQGAGPHLPIGAVGVAQAAHPASIRVLPHQRVVLSHDPGRAGLDTVGAIDVVGALDTVVRALAEHRTESALAFLS